MKTKVIFKKISWFDEPNPIVEINAIFLERSQTDERGELLYEGYAHIGQHTAIHEDFLNKNEVGVHKVENASYNDYKDLALELEQIGYELEILNQDIMKFFDKNYDELYVGADVSVPTPTTEDLWNFDFSGTILSFDKENNYCIVEDGDGDCWAVEPERLELE